jgi:hypothetical protein
MLFYVADNNQGNSLWMTYLEFPILYFTGSFR